MNEHMANRPPYIPGTPDELDAMLAAPENHTVIFENDQVRVLKVLVRPGEVEKPHTHKCRRRASCGCRTSGPNGPARLSNIARRSAGGSRRLKRPKTCQK